MGEGILDPVDVVRGVIETSSQKRPERLAQKIVAALREAYGLDAVGLRALEIAVEVAKDTHPVDHRYMENALARVRAGLLSPPNVSEVG